MPKRHRKSATRGSRACALQSGGKALAAAAAVAGGTHAYADVVRFENTGEFDWRPSECGGHLWLDITKAADDQSGQRGPTSFSQWYYYGTCNDPEKAGNYMYAGGSGGDGALWAQADGYSGTLDALEGGTLIGPDSAWGDRSTFSMYRSQCCYSNDWGPLGTIAYAGVQFKIGGQVHYGYIHAEMTDPRAAQLKALAWGYESEPNTPIAAGAGGTRCTGNEKAKAKCKPKRDTFRITASVKKAMPGEQITFRLDGDPDTDQAGQANNKGKAKTKFNNVSGGDHTVEVVGCDADARTSCG